MKKFGRPGRTLGFIAAMWAAAVVLCPAPAQADQNAAPVITDVRIGQHSGWTRFVVDLSTPMEFRVSTLPDPYRVVIDMPEVGWRLPARPLARGVGNVASFRYGLFKPGNSRLVIDLSGPARVKNAFVLPAQGDLPSRFVLDLADTTRAAFMKELAPPTATVGPPVGEGSVAMVTPVPPQRKPAGTKRVIVLDPGHGGVDPGTIGPAGTHEKTVTLQVAQEIKKALEATGRYRVVLTRDRDVFVRLRDRIKIAREAGAELFISIHADAIRDPKVRGASVYTLSETASDKEAQALAERENKADLIAGIDLSTESPELTNILIDLVQRETMNQSADFADMLVGGLKGQVPILRNPHRFAGFAVLKAPDVPSVLVELGFLSNAQDERALRDPRHRAKLAASVTETVNRYFTQLEKAERS